MNPLTALIIVVALFVIIAIIMYRAGLFRCKFFNIHDETESGIDGMGMYRRCKNCGKRL